MILVSAALLASAAEPPKITLKDGTYRLTGVPTDAVPPDGWQSVFAVYASTAPNVPPMLGEYSLSNGDLTFKPRFAVSPGVRTRAVYHPPTGRDVEAIFEGSAAPHYAATSITQIYPTADALPANLLRLYIQFSAPMRKGTAWQYIRLLDESGTLVKLPFLELDQELWDREGRRLTVLFDPGRIKRGVLPREQEGPALVEGRSYILLIDSRWPDENGQPLLRELSKRFRVTSELRQGIDLKQWKLQSPSAGSRNPLTLEFPTPLDFALQQRMIQVLHNGTEVVGKVTVEAGEKQWRFTPDALWKAGVYEVRVDTALEDLAGNKVGRPFDVDTFDRIERRVQRKYESLRFTVTAAQ